MANILETAGASISSFSWSSMGTILSVFVVVLLISFIFVAIFLLIWWKSYYIQVKIYEPYGQTTLTEEDMIQLRQGTNKEKVDLLKKANIKFDMTKIRRTHGKQISIRGTPYFSVFKPFKKIEPIPMDMMFSDGVHLLRLSNEIMIPIPKPETIINVGGNISISVADNNKWILWNNMMADRVNNKYQDVDAQKKAMMYFVVGIVAMVLLGAFILWLIYTSANKGLDATTKLSNVLDGFSNSIGGGTKPI